MEQRGSNIFSRKKSNFWRKVLKVFLLFLLIIYGTLLTLYLAVMVVFHVPAVQNKVVDEVVKFVSEKTGTHIEVGEIILDFPESLVLKNIYLEDQNQDTLLYSERIRLDIAMGELIAFRINVKEVALHHVVGHVHRNPQDSSFNYQFIIDAFSDTTQVPADTATPENAWEISVENVSLSDIEVQFLDSLTGNYVKGKVGEFNTRFDVFDLEEMRFHMDKSLLKNSGFQVALTPDTASVETDTTTASLPDIRLEELVIAEVKVSYKDKVAKNQLEADIPFFKLKTQEMNLPEQKVKVESIRLDSGYINYHQYATLPTMEDSLKDEPTSEESNWDIQLERTEISATQLVYNNDNFPEAKGEFDTNHVGISGLTLRADDFVMNEEGMEMNLEHMNFKNKNEITLKKLSGELFVGSEEISLDNGVLETSKSRVTSHEFSMTFPDPESFGEKMGTLGFSIDWEKGVLAMQDVFYFVPSLKENVYLQKLKERPLRFRLKGKGTLDKLRVEQFQLNMLEATVLDANGLFEHVTEPEKLTMDMKLRELSSNRQDITTFLSDTLLPENLTIPEQLKMSGTFNGSLSEFLTKLTLQTTLGDINLVTDYAKGDENAADDFGVEVVLSEFQLGKFLQDSTLGNVSLEGELAGRGLLKGIADWEYDVEVDEFTYQGHTFEDIVAEGEWIKDSLSTEVFVKDEWLTFDMKAGIKLDSPQFNMAAHLDLENANLYALGFYSDTLQLSTTLDFNGKWQDPENFEIHANLNNSDFYLPADTFFMKSFVFDGLADNRQIDFNLKSSIANGKLSGTVDPVRIPDILEAHLNEYFQLRGRPQKKLEDQPSHFTFDFKIKDSRLISLLFAPDLLYLKDGGLHGKYDSREHTFELLGRIDQVIYTENYSADSLRYEIISTPEKMDVNLRAFKLNYDSTIIKKPQLNGELVQNRFRVNVKVPDRRFQDRVFYMLGGDIESSDEAYILRLRQGEIILHNDLWQVSPDNYIKFTDEGIETNQMTLSHENSSFTFEAKKDNFYFDADSLELQTFARYLTNVDTTNLLSGKMNGEVRMVNYKGKPTLQSDLTIDDFSFKGAVLGDLSLRVLNPKKDFYKAQLDIESPDNHIQIDGVYRADREKNALDLTLDVDIDLSTLQPMMEGKLSQLEGKLTGALDVEGTLAAPRLLGNLKIKKTAFNVEAINSYFKMDDEILVFDREGIAFKELSVTDTEGKPFTVDGYIYTKDYRDFKFDMKIHADDFLAMNSSKSDNKFYYGKLRVDVDMDITGTLDRPDVDATIKFKEGTDLTYVNYEDELRTVGSEGVIKFVDVDAPVDSALIRARQIMLKDTLQNRFSGLDLKTNLMIDEKTKVTVITDPLSENFLYIQGGGELLLQFNRAGNITLDGTYLIQDGVFHISFYNLIEEDFNIKPESRVIFRGDPEDASADLVAIINKRARPLPLLTYFGTVLSDEQKSTYSQRMDFMVNLMLKGELLNPEISFQLGLAEIDKGRFPIVDANLAKLNEQRNQDLLEKQVFSLLVFGSFISNDPQTLSGTVNNAARQSINAVLANQLNALSDKFIKGVDVSFDLDTYQDYAGGGGERTKLGVQLSKQFLDERLNIQVGGRLDLTGLSDAEKQSLRDIAGDMAVIYALTRNRRYQLKAFRRLEFDALDGDIVTTGISLIYLREFNHFKDKELKNPEKKMKKEENKLK